MVTANKKIIFSGIQPSGIITIGNYLGAIKNWAKLQEDYKCLFCIVDLHAITVSQEPATLRKRSYESLVQLLAAGISPEHALIYIQSHVSAHAELAWILNCFTYMGELSRMTQFKDKAKKQGENIRVGLYDYPVLMAADILLFQSNLVPVGIDQKQHLELARDVAQRFNSAYSPTFVVPEPYIAKTGAKIMSLQEPTKKMSKSDENINSFVALLDDPDTIIRKFKRAVTDSESEVRYDIENKPGISNLMDIYSSITRRTMDEIQAEFEGKGYGDFKLAVAEAVINELNPIQNKFKELVKEKSYVENVIKESAKEVEYMANKTLSKVKRKVGFLKK